MMNIYTKKPQVHVLIAVAIIILAVIIFSNVERARESQAGSYRSQNENADSQSAPSTDLVKAHNESRKTVLERAEQYAKNSDYSTAIAILDEGLRLLPEDAEILAVKADYVLRYHDIVRASALTAAEQYSAGSEYDKAILEIQSALDVCENDVELAALYKQYVDEYRQVTFGKAEEVFQTSGYMEAISLLSNSLKTIPGDQGILSKIEDYKSYAPVSVDDLEIWQKGEFSCGPYTHEPVVDNMGNEYKSHYTGDTGGWGGANWTHFNVYMINGQYSRMTGKYCVKKSLNSTTSPNHFYVYGDGKLLASFTIRGGDLPIDFSIDISGVTYLKIQSDDSCAGWGGEEVAFAADLCLWK